MQLIHDNMNIQVYLPGGPQNKLKGVLREGSIARSLKLGVP